MVERHGFMGVGRCGLLWYTIVRSGAMCYGEVRRGCTAWYLRCGQMWFTVKQVRFGTVVQHGLTGVGRYGLVWCSTAWSNVVRCGTAWSGVVVQHV